MRAGTWSYAALMAAREAARQKGRLLMVVLCLAVGFAAFAATYGFSSRVLNAVQAESRGLLGADASVSVQGLMPQALQERIQSDPAIAGLAQVVDFPTLGATGEGATEKARLLEVRAVEGAYPLQGRVVLQGGSTLAAALARGVVVEGALAQAWGLAVAPEGAVEAELLARGQALRLGGRVVPVAGIVEQDDARQASAFALGPRIYLGLPLARDLGLVTARARLSSRLLLNLRPGTEGEALPRLKALARSVSINPEGRPRPSGEAKARIQSHEEAAANPEGRPRPSGEAKARIQSHEEAAAQLAQPLRNLNRFIRQLGLLTLLLALLGSWAILAAFLDGRRRDAAILRCLGAPPELAHRSFGLLTAGLLLAGGALGTLLGLLAARWMPRALAELIPAALRGAAPGAPPILESLLALALLALMVAPALARLGATAPLALLRDGAEPPVPRRVALLAWGGAAALAAFLVLRNAPTLGAGLGTLIVLAVLLGTLAGLLRLQLGFFRRSAARMPLGLRLAFGQLGARPGVSTLVMSVMGLALFLLLAAHFVKADLVAPILQAKAGDGRPNVFLLDVQPKQVAQVRALAKRITGHELREAPLVRARLRAVAGRPVEEAAEQPKGDNGKEPSRGTQFRTREQNLTWRAKLGPAERLTAGRYWAEDGQPHAEFSLEEGFAKEIGARLGDELRFDVQGQEVRGTVTSLRRVNWQSLAPNFFIVAHPSLLSGAPALTIAALEAPDAPMRQALQSALARETPNVIVVDLAEVGAKVGRVLDLVNLVAAALATLMLASALLVLSASLLSSRLGRQRDVALLRTLGAGEPLLLRSLAWEFSLLGGAAALTAGTLAWIGSWLYARKVLDLPSEPSPWLALQLLGLAALLTLVVGFLGSWRALRAEPLAVLRGE
ncbi:MAG: ABC transporter permease [Acidobacteria bacterium]|nr:ABC transporter permease [Acidobacteriota bacterium]